MALKNQAAEQLVPVARVAQAIGASVATTRRLVASGEIQGLWIGGRIKIRSDELARLLRSGTSPRE